MATTTTSRPVDTPAGPPSGGGRGGMGWIIAAVLVLALVGATAFIWSRHSNSPDPNANPQTAPSVQAQPAPDTAAAQTAFRTFYASVLRAYSAQNADLLDANTSDELTRREVANNISQLMTPGATHATADIRSITVTRATPTAVTLSVCALRDTRFINPGGRDVTITRDGKPAPHATQPLAQDAAVALVSNKWVVTHVEVDPTVGTPC